MDTDYKQIVAVLFSNQCNDELQITVDYYDKLLFNLETQNKSKQVNIPPV